MPTMRSAARHAMIARRTVSGEGGMEALRVFNADSALRADASIAITNLAA